MVILDALFALLLFKLFGVNALYILGITQVNPLKEDVKTYHWRFLNPKRVSPLDVDVDFENGMGISVGRLR